MDEDLKIQLQQSIKDCFAALSVELGALKQEIQDVAIKGLAEKVGSSKNEREI